MSAAAESRLKALDAVLDAQPASEALADELFAVVASGQVKIHIDQRYPLADVQQAHRDLEARKTTGCTIFTL